MFCDHSSERRIGKFAIDEARSGLVGGVEMMGEIIHCPFMNTNTNNTTFHAWQRSATSFLTV